MPLIENDYLPQTRSALFQGPWLVFAPHPDDETYGMGGSIAAARSVGIEVRVVILTDGALGGAAVNDLAQIREEEVSAAVAALGGANLSFWRRPDRGLRPDAACIGLAAALLEAHAGGTAFFPSPLEPHPDHRATAVLVWEALRQRHFPLTPVSYEISVQGPCNRLLDITPWIEAKRRAMAVYQTQEAQRPYSRRVLALNETRSWSLPDDVIFAEGFYVYPREYAPLAEALAPIHRRDRAGLDYNLPPWSDGADEEEQAAEPAFQPAESLADGTASESPVAGLVAKLSSAVPLKILQSSIPPPGEPLGGACGQVNYHEGGLASSLTMEATAGDFDANCHEGWRHANENKSLICDLHANCHGAAGHTPDHDRLSSDFHAKDGLLVVLATNTIGGAEIQTRLLLQALTRILPITLLTHAHLEPFFAALSSEDRGPALFSLVTFESHGLRNPFDYGRANMLAYARAIAVTARDSRAALIYGVMHNASLFLSLARWRHYRTLRHCKLVGSLHGSLEGYFAQRGSRPSPVEHALIRLTVRTCHALITPSVGLGEELVSRFGARRSQLAVIHNGLDLKSIQAQGAGEPPLAKTRPWILTCCRLADQKDFRTLIGAFARVVSKPLPWLVIVGEGPMAPQIQAWGAELGVSDRLVLVGFQTNPYPWIRQADIFVLSSHYEGFGMVIVEAMALGVPVVATDCPWGPAEIIQTGCSGALVPLGDEAALGGIFTRWLGDPVERERLAQGAQARAACFSAARMVDAYASLFRGMIRTEGLISSVVGALPWTMPSPKSGGACPDDRLGVLIFHPANVFGGAERTTVNLLSHLPRDRVRVVLVGMAGVFRAPLAEAFYDLEGHGLNPGGFSTLRRTLGETRRLVAIARKERCQVMLGMLHYGAVVAGLARPVSGWRLGTIASPRTPSVAGIRFHVGERSKAARLWRIMIKGFCRVASRLIVASSGLKEEAVQVFGAKPAKVRVIPNCVDDVALALARRQPPKLRERASPEEPWLLLTAGRLGAEKDTGTLLRAFARLRRRLDARLDILGSGPELDALRDLAVSLGIAAEVRFLGFSSRPFEEIRRADVFVHTGLFEGFGNTLLEAMACGVPLVATDCDFGPREIVTQGVNGLLVPVGDAESLARTLEDLLMDPHQRETLVANALLHVQNYSAGLMAQRYEAVFLELGRAVR